MDMHKRIYECIAAYFWDDNDKFKWVPTFQMLYCSPCNENFAWIAIPIKEKIESYVPAISSQHPVVENKEFDVQSMDLSFILKKLQMLCQKEIL